MPDAGQTSQFVDQIIERTLEVLSENPDFDEETLARLKELAGSSDLTDFQKVVSALSYAEGKYHENLGVDGPKCARSSRLAY